MTIDLSWWPYLEIPFPMVDGGLTLDLRWVDQLLTMVGRAVGPLLLVVAVFFAMRRLFVNWKGGE